jgi:hypothetical protein
MEEEEGEGEEEERGNSNDEVCRGINGDVPSSFSSSSSSFSSFSSSSSCFSSFSPSFPFSFHIPQPLLSLTFESWVTFEIVERQGVGRGIRRREGRTGGGKGEKEERTRKRRREGG